MTPLPMAFSEMYERMAIENHPIVKITNSILDYQMWLFLQMYFMPFRMATMGSDVDKWISSVSMNGLKSFNLCQPK
jgi:hypothetical protein